MPRKIRKKTATPPPKLVPEGRKSPIVDEGSSGSIDKVIWENTQGNIQSPPIQLQGNVSNKNQAFNRISALFDNIQNNPRSRSSSPDLESTPRPLRVLKGRKSFLSLNPGVPPRTTTPTPQGFRPKSMIRSSDVKTKGSNVAIPRQSPPTRSFLGLRLSSQKPQVFSPVNQPLVPSPQDNSQVMEPKLAKPKPAEVRFSLGTALKLPQASNVDLSRQNTMSSASTETSSNSIMTRTSVSHWMNWRQRSISDGPSVKTRSVLLDKGPSRAIKVVHPSIIYESMRHVESELPTPANNIAPRLLRRASSAGPGFFSLEQGISSLKFTRPLTPRPPTLTNIEGSGYVKVDSVGKAGVLSKVLCSIQDMSPPLSGNRATTIGTTKSHRSRQSIEGRVEQAAPQVVPNVSREGGISEPPVPVDTMKSKGTLRARGALGSIRRRFGSGSVRTLKTTEEDSPVVMQDIVRPQLLKEWITPPILQLHLDIHCESTREHVEGGREVWVCIEVEGRINNFQSVPDNLVFGGDPRGLDVAIVLDLSAHASPATFEDTKSMAKHLINSLSTIDNVSLTAFTSIQSSPGVETKYPLSKLTQSNRQHLFSFIDGLFGKAERQGTIRRDVKSILMAVIDDLKESTSHEILRESGRTSHLFLLTSSLRQGDMPAGTFESSEKQIKVHILGVGPLVTLQERPWKGGWIVILAPSSMNEYSAGSEILHALHNRIPTLPRIIDSLRYSVNFGELTKIHIGLRPCDGCKIMEVLGDSTFDKLVPGEKRAVFVKLQIGPYNPVSVPGTSMNTPDKNKEHQIKLTPRRVSVDKALDILKRNTNDQVAIPEYKLLERQLAATLGDIETSALAVSVSYEHEYFGTDTVITTKKVLKIQRYDGDGNWSLSRNLTINSSGEGNSEDCTDSICSTDFLIPTAGQEPCYEDSDGDMEYVRTMLAKKIAEMTIGQGEENPRKALRVVEELGIRGRGVYAVASELEWRVKIQEEEEQTERAMKGLAVEISRKARRQSQLAAERSDNDVLDVENNLSLHASSHSQGAGRSGSFDACETKVNHRIQKQACKAVPKARDSSIIIHAVTSTDRPSSLASQSDEAEASDLDDTHDSVLEGMSGAQPSGRRHDHVDEARRIWKELAETKMGLRRDVRPGRYRTPNLSPMLRRSRHNSMDLLRDRHDKERAVDVDWTILTSGRVKGKKKERRRRMKKQAKARRSMTGEEDGLGTGYQTPFESVAVSLTPGCVVDKSKTPVSESRKRKDSLSAPVNEQNDDLATERQDGLSASEASTRPVESVTSSEQSNRDTMKSLITLRDVKETDFSPWAC